MKRSLLGVTVGIGALVAYLNFALGWVALSERLTLLLAFGIGPAAIFGVLALSDRLAIAFSPRTIRCGSVFLIIGFSLLTLMLTMQQAIFAEYRELRGGRPTVEAPKELRQAFALANQVQLGADVAFDIFYSLGIVITSSALVGHTGIPRVVGAYGCIAGLGLLGLNIWTFPTPPAAAGSVDLGPASIVWWVGIILLEHRLQKRTPTEGGSERGCTAASAGSAEQS